LFYGVGGLFGLASLALPDAAVHDTALLLVVSLASLAAGGMLIAVGGRLPQAGSTSPPLRIRRHVRAGHERGYPPGRAWGWPTPTRP
jgi:hypothetical protein